MYQILNVSNLSLNHCGRDTIVKFFSEVGTLDLIWWSDLWWPWPKIFRKVAEELSEQLCKAPPFLAIAKKYQGGVQTPQLGAGWQYLLTRQARIQDFCQGRAPREWWPYKGWEWAIFDIRKHRFATFLDVYCHIMLEWRWTTIQETPVSLLSALETREPAPSALVPPS